MFYFFVSILFIPSLIQAQNGDLNCSENQKTTTPPYYVTSGTKQRNQEWENMRTNGNNTHYVKRGSVVYAPQGLSADKNRDVVVKLVSTPEAEMETNFRQSKRMKNKFLTGERKAAKDGEIYSINKLSLVEAGDFVFFVREDSPVKHLPGFHEQNFKGIKLVKEDNQYIYQKCCLDTEHSKCFHHYQFETIDEDAKKKTFFLNPELCSLNLTPVPIDDYPPILKLLNDGYKIDNFNPLMENKELSSGARPFLVQRQPRNGLERYGSRGYAGEEDYLAPWTYCAFEKMREIFQQFCPFESDMGCTLLMGDCYTEKSSGWTEHSTHYTGECFDMRPMRVVGDNDLKYGLTYIHPRYSRERTKTLLKIISAIDDSSTVYFNDPQLLQDFKGDLKNFKYEDGHYNHLHICFDPNSEKVRNACRDDAFVENAVKALSNSDK